MDFDSEINYSLSTNHDRTIVHIDLDCFYAQVEVLKNPGLKDVPFGVQQKTLVVTSNYLAREKGVKKCMLVTEALKICPELILVRGEDLYDYRQMSAKVTAILQKHSPLVEKLGLDENFIDVSEIVLKKLDEQKEPRSVGIIYGHMKESCSCGCVARLNIGSQIAAQMRKDIFNELNLTCCAGIATNKLLAKLVGSKNKPNAQTLIYPCNAMELMSSLKDIRAIPGIGRSLYECLKTSGITTVEQLQQASMKELESVIGKRKSEWVFKLSYGEDYSVVKPSGKPQSIGLEDSFKTITVETEAREKFKLLLGRLMVLLSEDGRIPRTIKVCMRKYDHAKKVSYREQRQCNILPTLFSSREYLHLSEQSETKLLNIIMKLFHKLVDIKKPFHITLLGLSFSKFQERASGSSSIASFFKNDVSVQSLTSLQSDSADSSVNSSTSMDISYLNDSESDENSETEVEPSPKKLKILSPLIRELDGSDVSSPSKLRVADLKLNGKSSEESFSFWPSDIDKEVFQELPTDLQKELLEDWKKRNATAVLNKPNKAHLKPKNNTLLNYFSRK